jgi:hypothetical protein
MVADKFFVAPSWPFFCFTDMRVSREHARTANHYGRCPPEHISRPHMGRECVGPPQLVYLGRPVGNTFTLFFTRGPIRTRPVRLGWSVVDACPCASERVCRTAVWVAPSLAGRCNRTDACSPTHPWPRFGPGLHRAGRGRTTRLSSRLCRWLAWQPPRCDEMLLAPALAMKRQHATTSMSAQKLRHWPLTQATIHELLCQH